MRDQPKIQTANRNGHSGSHPSPITHHSSPEKNRIDQTFAELKGKGEKALIAYIMAGDPSLAETEQLVLALEQAGADLIELGVPFSDPIADGPVIQQAAERALRNGTSLRQVLAAVKSLRQRTQIPLVLMLYYNSIHAMGLQAFCRAASDAGVDGLIVPDMPPDEAGPLKGPAVHAGLRLIFLLAPTSTAARRTYVAKEAQGFLYYVSVTGITGAKIQNMPEVGQNVAKIRKSTKTPVAVGFGVSTPEDAKQVAAMADGVIVGSAIVKQIVAYQQQPDLVQQVAVFVGSLKDAIRQNTPARPHL
jgi:tryptophan synthase alpha chain